MTEFTRLLFAIPSSTCAGCGRGMISNALVTEWCDHCTDHMFAHYVAPVIHSMAGRGSETMRHILRMDDEPGQDPAVFYMDMIRH